MVVQRERERLTVMNIGRRRIGGHGWRRERERERFGGNAKWWLKGFWG